MAITWFKVASRCTWWFINMKRTAWWRNTYTYLSTSKDSKSFISSSIINSECITTRWSSTSWNIYSVTISRMRVYKLIPCICCTTCCMDNIDRACGSNSNFSSVIDYKSWTISCKQLKWTTSITSIYIVSTSPCKFNFYTSIFNNCICCGSINCYASWCLYILRSSSDHS